MQITAVSSPAEGSVARDRWKLHGFESTYTECAIHWKLAEPTVKEFAGALETTQLVYGTKAPDRQKRVHTALRR